MKKRSQVLKTAPVQSGSRLIPIVDQAYDANSTRWLDRMKLSELPFIL